MENGGWRGGHRPPNEITRGLCSTTKVQFVVSTRLHFLNFIFVSRFTINFILMIVIKNIFEWHYGHHHCLPQWQCGEGAWARPGPATVWGKTREWAVATQTLTRQRQQRRRRKAKKLALGWMRNENKKREGKVAEDWYTLSGVKHGNNKLD